MEHHKTGLIADIGATNARFALLYDGKEGAKDVEVLKCADFDNFADAAEDYLSRVAPNLHPKEAVAAVAGPVTGDWVEMTNHPWHFSIDETRDRLEMNRLDVINDFLAVARAIPHIKDGDMYQVGEGTRQPEAPIGVIGPGTGLGVAYLTWCDGRYTAHATEGGHVTLPVVNAREFDIVRHLFYKYRHVSAERCISGKGLVNLYNAINALDGRELPERRPSEITDAALKENCEACVEALDLFCAFLGRIAGNYALALGAHGGIFIAGGIPPKLGDYFARSRFRESYLAKGRFDAYLDPIPTFVITHDFPAFLGLEAVLEEG